MGAGPDEQLSLTARCRPSDHWITDKHLKSFNDFGDPCRRICDREALQMGDEPIEIIECLECDFKLRHSANQRAKGRPCGRGECSPRARLTPRRKLVPRHGQTRRLHVGPALLGKPMEGGVLLGLFDAHRDGLKDEG